MDTNQNNYHLKWDRTETFIQVQCIKHTELI